MAGVKLSRQANSTVRNGGAVFIGRVVPSWASAILLLMKTIVITGGSDGLGRALAEAIASDTKVVILGRDEQKLREVAERSGCDWRQCDVTDAEAVDRVINQIALDYGTVDVLVNNAGIFHEGELADASYDDIYKVINVNTTGALYCAKAVLQHMRARKSGLIINVISQGGLNTRPKRAVYTASKWALTGMTKALQQELGEYNIRVTGFYPGVMQTEFLKKAGIDEMGASITLDDAVKAMRYIIDCSDDILIPEFGVKNVQRLI